MHVARLARRAGGAVALAGCVALGGFMAPAAFAQDPGGNNGTVKVDGVAFGAHQNNEPHVGCIFEIDFYNYDAGGLEATVTFTGQAPTGKGIVLVDSDTVELQDDPAGGGTDVDAQVEYDLSSLVGQLGDAHEQQGYHIKLTVHAEGSKGADTKHKVFWVKCAPTPSPTPTTPTPSKTPSKSPEPSESATSPAPVPTDVPAGAGGASGDGSAAGLLGLAVVVGGAVAGTAVIARRRFLHDS
ncbi:MAG TPA: hypothetical protein VFP81_02550 [Propionibacteriaceae bacterium]|nr:hypothetical protein [Propionibacteriaceae bacterium]